ncbi:MAG TPA: hypothetical protein VFJ58_01660 [Armatimonadota bacterium]|nr:hypothetical protein [Armatimonadota bacterium]
MNRKEMPYDEFVELLAIRLREMRDAPPEEQERLGRMAWRMTLRDVPWRVVLAAIRTEFGASREPEALHVELLSGAASSDTLKPSGYQSNRKSAEYPPERPFELDPRDLSPGTPPALRHEVGRYERERLSSNTRQAIRMARHARRWHEIRKMRSVLMNIDQGYLKRMLGAESDTLNQEINALLRSWAPLVRERQQSGRGARRRR